MRTYLFYFYCIFSSILCINLKSQNKENLPIAKTLFYAKNIKCSNINCKSPNFCNEENNICHCAKGYLNSPNTKDLCSYKQFNQLNSFLWELLLNSGIGHMIIGKFVPGIVKLSLSLILFTLCVLYYGNFIKTDEEKKNKIEMNIIISIYLCFLCSFIWWVVDAFCFGFNKFKDVNNFPLMHW